MPEDKAEYALDRSARLDEMVTYRLARLQAKLNTQATKILKKNGGLTLTQWRVLVVLDLRDEVNLALLVRETKFDKAQLSRSTKTMIENGLLNATPSESDQRQTMLSMTAKGRAAFEKALLPMRSRQRQLLAALSDEQRQTLFAAFDSIEGAIADPDTAT